METDAMSLSLFALLIGAGCFFITALFWLKRSFERSIDKRLEEVSLKAMEANISSVLTLAGQSLEEKSKHIHDALNAKEESFRSLVTEMRSQVQNYQQEIKQIAKEHAGSFMEMKTLISEQSNAVGTLANSTEKLSRVLHTNNLRGQWGERIAEDILKSSGLIEGIHYQRNKALELSPNRPDFTFFLPDEHKVNVDVKFPVANLVRAQETQDAMEQKRLLKDFETDVKKRIDEVSKRDYINAEENTVDFAILFVPSESVYSMIFAASPMLFQFADERKVVLASPFTLMSILKVVHQSFRHFHFEQKIREIVTVIEKLGEDMGRFQERFELFGEQINKMQAAYKQIAETSFHKIKSKMEQIEKYQIGSDAPQNLKSEEHEKKSLLQ